MRFSINHLLGSLALAARLLASSCTVAVLASSGAVAAEVAPYQDSRYADERQAPQTVGGRYVDQRYGNEQYRGDQFRNQPYGNENHGQNRHSDQAAIEQADIEQAPIDQRLRPAQGRDSIAPRAYPAQATNESVTAGPTSARVPGLVTSEAGLKSARAGRPAASPAARRHPLRQPGDASSPTIRAEFDDDPPATASAPNGAASDAELVGQVELSEPVPTRRDNLISSETVSAGPKGRDDDNRTATRTVHDEPAASGTSATSTAKSVVDEPAKLALPKQAKPLELSSPKARGEQSTKTPGANLTTLFSSLAMVLGLFFVVVLVFKKGMPKQPPALPREALEVLGRSPLTPRQHVQMLRVGNKLLLVCIHATSVETLTEITDPLEVDRICGLCYQTRPTSATGSFRQALGQFTVDRGPSFLKTAPHKLDLASLGLGSEDRHAT